MKLRLCVLFNAMLILSLSFTVCGSSPNTSISATDELDMILREVSDYLNESIPAGKKIAIINIQSDSTAFTEYIINVLIANAVNDRIFSVVDRQQLDAVRAELNFNMSGEVSDQSAQSVGKMLGAQTIITGTISQVGRYYRMNIRALEVETALVQGSNNWNIVAGSTVTALMRSGSKSSEGINSEASVFFGTWLNDNKRTLIINANRITYRSIEFGDFYSVIVDCIWTAEDNTDVNMIANYPRGFKVSGTITESNNFGNDHLPIYLFINKNDNNIIHLYLSNGIVQQNSTYYGPYVRIR